MISRSNPGWLIVLLLALLVFILILLVTLPDFRGPTVMCELAELRVSIDIAGHLVEVEFPVEEPIEVEPDEFVIITAEIKTGPEGCEGAFSVDWRLLFESNPSQIELSRFPTSEVLEFKTGAHTSDDLIVLTVKDSSGSSKRREFLPLKVKGE